MAGIFFLFQSPFSITFFLPHPPHSTPRYPVPLRQSAVSLSPSSYITYHPTVSPILLQPFPPCTTSPVPIYFKGCRFCGWPQFVHINCFILIPSHSIPPCPSSYPLPLHPLSHPSPCFFTPPGTIPPFLFTLPHRHFSSRSPAPYHTPPTNQITSTLPCTLTESRLPHPYPLHPARSQSTPFSLPTLATHYHPTSLSNHPILSFPIQFSPVTALFQSCPVLSCFQSVLELFYSLRIPSLPFILRHPPLVLPLPFILPHPTPTPLHCTPPSMHSTTLSLHTILHHPAPPTSYPIYIYIWISITISLKFVRRGPINNIPALVQIMAWRRSGDKPLSEPMMVSLLTHICVTRPQWVIQKENLFLLFAYNASGAFSHLSTQMDLRLRENKFHRTCCF